MDLEKLIAEKEAALAEAKNQASILEQQVAALRSAAAAAQPTEFELMLHGKKHGVPSAAGESIQHKTASVGSVQPGLVTIQKPDVDLFADNKISERVRNPKGLGEKIARMVLSPENQTLDDLEIAINIRAEKPVSRPAVRTLMMNLKKNGYAVSDTPGVFRLAEKEEASANSRSAEASIATESTGS